MFYSVRKRALSVVLAIFFCLFLPAGCSRQDSTPSSQAQGEPVVLTAQISRTRYNTGLKKMIEKLEQEENIRIECQLVPDDQSLDIIKMQINSGEALDLIDSNIPNAFDQVDPEKYLVDFSGEEWTQRLVVPSVASYSGKVYGFPLQSMQNVHVFIYNREVFAQAGIEHPPTTWEELLADCEALKNNGVTPIYMSQDKWVCQILATTNFETALGPERSAQVVQELLSGELKWTDVPEFETVLDCYLELFQKGYVNSDYLSTDFENAADAIGRGEAAMHFNGNSFVNTVKEPYPDSDIGLFPLNMPGIPSDIAAGNLNSIGFIIPQTTQKLDVIKKVFSLWSTPDYLDLYFESIPGFPAFTEVNPGDYSEELNQLIDQYIEPGRVYADFLARFGPAQTCIDKYLWGYLVEMPSQPDMTGRQILERFQADFEEYLNKHVESP